MAERLVTRDPQKLAADAALASLLNLTFLPGLALLWMLLQLSRATADGIDRYHLRLGIRINLAAAVALLLVSALMLLLGGFDSAWTWMYVIIYFTSVHTVFIVTAVWAMVRAWNGQRLRS
ncbi:MAG: hypothetical protein KDI68_03945 [Gammaproteobacteria bacterium]|nr:hypothetical protein [Gammaproteobacteria bacterium]